MEIFIQPCPCGENFFHEHGANFYVSVVDAGRTGLLAGPYTTHAEALRHLDPTRDIACRVQDRAWFYSFGTLAMKDGYRKPGLLNDLLAEEYAKQATSEQQPEVKKRKGRKCA